MRQPYPAPNTRILSQTAATSGTQYLCTRPGNSLIWRRYGGGVGNRCRWVERFAMSEQLQSMEKDLQRSRELFRTDRGRPCPREWEGARKRSAAGGMERSGSLCGKVAAPRGSLHGRQCGSIGKQLPAGALRATAEAPWRRAIGKKLQTDLRFVRLRMPV